MFMSRKRPYFSLNIPQYELLTLPEETRRLILRFNQDGFEMSQNVYLKTRNEIQIMKYRKCLLSFLVDMELINEPKYF